METKICSKCGQTKPIFEFFKKSNSKPGHRASCKQCRYDWRKLPHVKVKQNHIRRRWRKRPTVKAKEKVYKDSYRSDPAKIVLEQKTRKKYNARPEVQAKRREYVNARRKDPIRRLDHSVSTGVWKSLKGNKAGRSWEKLVDYSLSDLKKHLEQQFIEGMTWDNYGEWHVDHIIPKAVFKITGSDCVAFRCCWSLENLRPLWKIENLRKWAKL